MNLAVLAKPIPLETNVDDKDKAIQTIFKYYYEKVPMEQIKAMSNFQLTGFVEADLMTLLLIGEEDI